MKKRSIWAVLLLPIITLGIYNFVWYYKIFNEVRSYTDDTSLPSGGKVIGFYFIPFFNIIWALMVLFSKLPKLVHAAERKSNIQETDYGMFIIFALLLESFYPMYVQYKINKTIDASNDNIPYAV